MKPRKLVILCCLDSDQACVFAYVAKNRLPIRMLIVSQAEEALAMADKHDADLLLFINFDWAPGFPFDVSLDAAKVLFEEKRPYPILILDKRSTEEMIPYVTVPMIWSHKNALELIRLNLANKHIASGV